MGVEFIRVIFILNLCRDVIITKISIKFERKYKHSNQSKWKKTFVINNVIYHKLATTVLGTTYNQFIIDGGKHLNFFDDGRNKH